MPTINIVNETAVADSFRVQQVRGMFDLSDTHIRHAFTAELPLEEHPWRVGLIVGASGAGKTSLAKKAFPNMVYHTPLKWSGRAVVDDFDQSLSVKDVCQTLTAVGFSTPPHWLKPFAHLSCGQQFRVELARALLENKSGVVFDEFTSVVDRDVAKVGCLAVSKFLRSKERPPFVAVSCHYDIVDWLDPDWVYDVSTSRFTWRLRRQRKPIKIDVYESNRSAWQMFRQYHYLDTNLSNSAKCFIACYAGKPVGFAAVLHFPHPSAANIKIEHRLVVLPDYQGIGIGNRLSEFVAAHYVRLGFRYRSVTSAPSMIHYRSKSAKWVMNRLGRAKGSGTCNALFTDTKAGKGVGSAKRITGGFEYVGGA